MQSLLSPTERILKICQHLPKLWARIVFDSRVLDEFSPHTYETWCPTVFHQIYRAACFTSTLQLLQQPVHFKSHFPGETGLAMCPTLWFSCSIYYWSVCPPGTGPTLRILGAVPPSFLLIFHLPCSFNLCRHSVFRPISVILALCISQPPQSTFPDNQTDWFQVKQFYDPF